MSIDANWIAICAILDTGNACGGDECEQLCRLIEEGMRHFGNSGNAPDTLPISVDNCMRIYAALHDRYCNG